MPACPRPRARNGSFRNGFAIACRDGDRDAGRSSDFSIPSAAAMMAGMTQAQQLEEQADRAVAAGQYGAARSLLEQAVGGGGSSFGLWHKLSAMRKALGDLPGALAAVDQALTFSPLDFSALLARAMILDQL